jgi:alpha-beta hydrolase superfamily lysophospholipase
MSLGTSTPNSARNVILIHGLFLTRLSWEKWVERYSARGFNVLAPPWPGLEGSVEELRTDPTALTKLDIKMIVDHLDGMIRRLDSFVTETAQAI